MPCIEYRQISKEFDGTPIIRDLSLRVADGEFIVLLGPSGCGKTTLLRMTAGLESITSGEVLFDGRRMNDIHPRQRDVAMVFQNYALYPTMRVWENIGFALEVQHLRRSEIRARVEEVAAVLGLGQHLDSYPRELSGGQRQRVAMGRAMVRNARIFLFDEPLSNLDAKLRAQMRLEIRQLHDRLGTTTVYVTHDQVEAMTMADRIVLMNGGAVEQVGTPDALFDRPTSRYAADFIGTPSINLVDGVIACGPSFQAEGVQLPLDPRHNAPTGCRVTCGMRPSDLSPCDDGPLHGRIIIAERTGVDTNLHINIGTASTADNGGNTPPIVMTVPRSSHARIGDVIRFGIAPGRIHIFDQASGKRM